MKQLFPLFVLPGVELPYSLLFDAAAGYLLFESAYSQLRRSDANCQDKAIGATSDKKYTAKTVEMIIQVLARRP